MKTPYEILDISADASDSDIKLAYLQKVKDNPPDRDQEQFQIIHNAYLAIKDNKSRLSYALFKLPTADFDELLDQALNTTPRLPLTSEHFDKLLCASIDDSTFLNAMSSPEKS
jgi:DnaJ-class molecular chaperone